MSQNSGHDFLSLKSVNPYNRSMLGNIQRDCRKTKTCAERGLKIML